MAHNLTSFLFTPISIHLMLLFIGCSTSFRLLLHFNTSHVTVYQVEIAGKKYTWTHFNTSHVTVYPITIDTKRFQFCDFNTSHVTVYQRLQTFVIQENKISIHLMLLFITFLLLTVGGSLYFNTSHVTVYPGLSLCGQSSL